MESINVSLPLWRDKKLKILGLVSAQRLSLAPEIPTIAETFPGYDLGIWQSIVAPVGTPRDVVVKLFGSIKKVLAMVASKARRSATTRSTGTSGGRKYGRPYSVRANSIFIA